MHLDYYKVACYVWLSLALVWTLAALTTKPAARRQSAGSRLLEAGLSILAGALVFGRGFRSGWQARTFLDHSDASGALGLTLVIAGIAFAIWARLQLGGNWSGEVTVKQGHTLVRQGPYTLVRHPIYSGILLAMFGTALIVGEYRALFGCGVLLLSYWLKSRVEERFMLEQFGAEYAHYRQQVKGLIPYVF